MNYINFEEKWHDLSSFVFILGQISKAKQIGRKRCDLGPFWENEEKLTGWLENELVVNLDKTMARWGKSNVGGEAEKEPEVWHKTKNSVVDLKVNRVSTPRQKLRSQCVTLDWEMPNPPSYSLGDFYDIWWYNLI